MPEPMRAPPSQFKASGPQEDANKFVAMVRVLVEQLLHYLNDRQAQFVDQLSVGGAYQP